MTTFDARRRHQQQVDALLDALEERRRRIYVLKAHGARPAGLRDLKAELQTIRTELAATVGTAS
jgi:hypothetical protein